MMQPKVICKDTIHIAGVIGDGTDTRKLWGDFEERYNSSSFFRIDKYAYEVRFDYAGKCDCHVGFRVDGVNAREGFTTLSLPPSQYAVFEMFVAREYESENRTIEEWLIDNSDNYAPTCLEGKPFLIGCYNDKFRGGDKPDSIMEIWIPVCKIDSA